MKSFIRGSVDFLNQVPGNISNDSILVSFDVENLYTCLYTCSSITHELGIKAIQLNKYPEYIPSRINILEKGNTVNVRK